MLSHAFAITLLLLSSMQLASFLRQRGCQAMFQDQLFRHITRATHAPKDLRQTSTFCQQALYFKKAGQRYEGATSMNRSKIGLFLK